MRYAMIMAGGSGTRLWPVSREGQPKQLVPFIHGVDREGGRAGPVSLLQIAADRLEGLVPQERRYICAAERHRAEILDAVPGFDDDRILGEPVPRDTVNAVGFGAAVFGKLHPDAVFAVLTADHIIRPREVFLKAMNVGFDLVEEDPSRLVSLGVTPTEPATGFGYIERREPIDGTHGLGFTVERFVEKPPRERAEEYLASGRFFWNAGMFVFSAKTLMAMLYRHRPDTHAGMLKIREAWGTPTQHQTLDAVYPRLPKISVDYAIMEPGSSDPDVTLCGVEMDAEWLDVGSWPSYGETIAPDGEGNRAAGARLFSHDSRGNVVVGSEDAHAVALVGCEGLIVVHTPRATLVMPKERAQDLKKLHAELPDDLR